MDIGDINGDGRADSWWSATHSGSQIGVLLQNAAGTLDSMVTYSTVNANQVKVGDFNGDGRWTSRGSTGARRGRPRLFLQTEPGHWLRRSPINVPHLGFERAGRGRRRRGRSDRPGRDERPGHEHRLRAAADARRRAGDAEASYTLGGSSVVTGGGGSATTTATDARHRRQLRRQRQLIHRAVSAECQGTMDPAVSVPVLRHPDAIVAR